MEVSKEVSEGTRINDSLTNSTEQDVTAAAVEADNKMERSKKFEGSGNIETEKESAEVTELMFVGDCKIGKFEKLSISGSELTKEEVNGKHILETEHPWSTSLGDDITYKTEYYANMMKSLTESLRLVECDLNKSRGIYESSLLLEALELLNNRADEEYLSFLTRNKIRMQEQILEYEKMRENLISKLSNTKERWLHEVIKVLNETETEDCNLDFQSPSYLLE